jgi:hypothetical protein
VARDHSFAEPVALSSTGPTDFRLPPTTAGTDFVLVALRARRKWHPRARTSPVQDSLERPPRYLRKVQFSTLPTPFSPPVERPVETVCPPTAGESRGGRHTGPCPKRAESCNAVQLDITRITVHSGTGNPTTKLAIVFDLAPGEEEPSYRA